MKKYGIGSRVLAALLALIMIVSVLPLSVFAADDGDLQNGVTGLDGNINTLDTISWPIKIYDYLNDGMLFEYASAQDSSLTNLGGDAYGGGVVMPGNISYGGNILGSDFTVNSSEIGTYNYSEGVYYGGEYYDTNCYSHWLEAKSNYASSVAQQGSGTSGAFKFLRLQPWLTKSDMPAMVISDFDNDYRHYLSGTTTYPRDRVRYAVLVYKTNVNNLELTMGLSTNLTGAYTIKDYNGNSTAGPDGYYVNFDLVTSKYLVGGDSWNYVVVDMNAGRVGERWDSITKVYQVILDNNMTDSSQYLDLSHIAYFSTAEEATRFGEAAKAFCKKPGEYLPDQYYTVNGTSYSKHWNMGNNTAFTMLRGSNGGGWSGNGGANTWENGYYSYYIGKDTYSENSTANSRRNDAKNKYGYPVPDPESIYYFSVNSNTSKDLSGYDFGYKLYNTITAKDFGQVMTAGLLKNDLISIVGVDGKTVYRVPQYKETAVEYIALLLSQTLAIGRQDKYGNYNYNFVQGSVSSQFADAQGNKRDLASALREALQMKAPTSGLGNYTYSTAMGEYGDTAAKASKLIGPYQQVKGNITTFCDAAYYLLHNLFVDDSYNQTQDEYNYLVLSKANVSGEEAFVFDAGFTTGNIESDPNSKSAVVYNKENGTISLSSAIGKDEICYSGGQWTTRNPFLPVTDAEGDYGCTGTPYFREDGARTYADYGDTYVNRNYNYVMQANAEFVYHYQDDLFFQFEGDDDVYLFVNGELVLDIGAAHSITSVKMQMNDYVLQAQKELSFLKQNYGYRPDMADDDFEELLNTAKKDGTALTAEQKDAYRRWHRLNLVDGETYSIDFYYMERHGWGANMRVATNILMTDPAVDTEKKAYQDGAEISYGGIVVPEELVEYSFSLTNKGEGKLYNLTFNDYDIGLTLSPKDGLSFHNDNINGVTVTDARGLKLDPSDLIIRIDGYRDEEKQLPVSVDVRLDGQNPNEELKQLLRDLTSNDGTEDKITDDPFSGVGLWRHATITIRGIYYRMTQEQIEDEQFNNTLFTTCNPAVDSDLILNSADIHQIRLIGDARHIYQWTKHDVHFTREELAQWLGGSFEIGSTTLSVSNAKLATCRKDGTTFDFPDIIVRDGTSITVNYWKSGSHLFFIKVFRDNNSDQIPDDLNRDNQIDENDYLIVPLAVFSTDLQNDVVVLDYGLKAELTGKNGIVTNDYITVPFLGTHYSIMGMTKATPAYPNDKSNNNYNRISFAPVSGSKIAFDDGEYEFTTDTNDDKLYFTPTDFMDETYEIYIAVSIHEPDFTPTAVSVGNNGKNVDITKEVQMYQKITVLPATVMYYEDDFAGIKLYSEDGVLTSGTGSDVLMQGVDQSVNYGADQTYQTKDNAQYSGNSLTAIRISQQGELAQFTFTGTGFDLLGRTNAFDSGSFIVHVKDGKETENLTIIPSVDATELNNLYEIGTTSVGTYTPASRTIYLDASSALQSDWTSPQATYSGSSGTVTMRQVGQRRFSVSVPYFTDSITFTDGNNSSLNVTQSIPYDHDVYDVISGYWYVSKATRTIYFEADSTWYRPYAYYWSEDNKSMVAQPGATMSVESDTLFRVEVPVDATGIKFINVLRTVPVITEFSNDSDAACQHSDRTEQVAIPTDGTNLYNGYEWSVDKREKAWGGQTFYYDNSTTQWSKVYAWAYDSNGTFTTQWPGTEMQNLGNGIYAAGLDQNAVKVILHDGNGAVSGGALPVNGNSVFNGSQWSEKKTEGTWTAGKVYYDNTQTQWETVYVCIYDANGNATTAWPGTQMKIKSGIAYAQVPDGSAKVIFHDGTAESADEAEATELTLPADGRSLYDGARWLTYYESSGKRYQTVAFDNTATQWTNVYIYAYGPEGSLNGSWPGKAAQMKDGSVYSSLIPGDATHVVFTNGEGKRTDVRLAADGSNLYDGSSWCGYDAATNQKYRVLSFDTTVTKWESVYLYAYTTQGQTKVALNDPWPGVAMADVGNNIYSLWITEEITDVVFNGVNHNTSGHCNSCGSYVGHAYYMDQCPCGEKRLDYYLVGFINEEDYGCEADYLNMGQYKFKNGKLTATFKTDGYVFVKTTDNSSFFMTDGYPGGNVTSAYLYNTNSPGLQADKLHVPGGVELTFTLVQHTDDTLILSYTTSSDDVADQDKTVYFNNIDDWSQIYAYYWSSTDATMINWPGELMDPVASEDSVYVMELPLDAEYVLFTDGSGIQTGDLTVPADNMIYSPSGFNKGWSVYNPGKTTLSFDNTDSKWKKVFIYYWSDQEQEMLPWPGDEMTSGADNLFTAAIPSNATKVLFHNGDGSQTADLDILRNGDIYVYGIGWASTGETDAVRTVYFQNTDKWASVYVHYWDAVNGGNLVSWPGDVMLLQSRVDGIYKASIPETATHVVFNNGGDEKKTLDLELDERNLFIYDKAAAETKPVGSWSVYGESEQQPETPTSRTVYLINNKSWSTPTVYYWGGSGSVAWPGVSMSLVSGNRYSVAVPLDAKYIIFSNNGADQSKDLALIEGLDVYDNNSSFWTGNDLVYRTVYLDNNAGWGAPNAYFWIETPDTNGNTLTNNLTAWPGVSMTQVSGNRYQLRIPAAVNRIIFNDGSNQTSNLNVTAGLDLFNISTGAWSSSGIVEQDTTPKPIYYANTNHWEKVHVYYWSDSNGSMVAWPGVEMTQGEDGVFCANIPGNAQYVIFSNGYDGENDKTANLTLPVNGGNYYSVPAASCGIWQNYEPQRMVYFDAAGTEWSGVNAYYWSAKGDMVSWPGVAMTLESGTVYKVKLPVEAEMIIFNSGSQQTENLSITETYDKYTYSTGEWSSTTRMIYFEGSGVGSVRLHYSDANMNTEKMIMTRIKNNFYSAEIPADTKYVLFEDGEVKVGPMILSDDHDLYTAQGRGVFDPVADYRRVVYFENTQGWENVYIHYWGESVNETVWPGQAMTFVDDRMCMTTIPVGVAGVVFNDGKDNCKSIDLKVPDVSDLFTIDIESDDENVKENGYGGTWTSYTKSKTDAVHQIPTLRVQNLPRGTYTVEIQGVPTYTSDVDWFHKEDYVKTTYFYLDGVRIYRPLGETNDMYSNTENGAEFKELRNMILAGKAAVASYKHGKDSTTAYTGNVSWTENRNGTGGDMETVYIGNQLSGIDDYLLLGPNNETYLNGNAQTQAVIFYVKETEGIHHSLQIGARGLDAGLFMGGNSAGVNATLYHGVTIQKPDGSEGYGWRPMDTILSGTEQYYTVDYWKCPYTVENGVKIYQIALFVRSGMVSFTNIKYIGLDVECENVGDATELQLLNGTIYVDKESSGTIGTTQTQENSLATKLASISLQMEATQWIEDEQQSIVLKYPALSFEDEVYYNVFFTTSELKSEPVEMGLLMFDTLEEDGTIYDASAVISGVTTIDGMYVARSLGVQAKDLGKTMYFRVFAQLADGSYVYSKAASYSVRQYAKAVLDGNYSAATKELIAAMLKYGEAARNYFGGVETVGDLITDSVSSLTSDYRTDLLADVVKADPAKVGRFAATSTGFLKKAPAVSFDGAFAINYFFTPSTTVQGNMTLYYWNAEDYEGATELTADNATGSMVMTPGARYSAAITGIAAKDMDSTYYVAVVYQSNGQTYCSGVLAYSLAAYCKSMANNAGAVSELAKATAVYGYHAKKLFG